MPEGPSSGGRTALLERGGELARVDQLLAASPGGGGACLVIEGRSGIGKTVLLSEVKARAQRAGMSVHSARGTQLDGEFAFGVVRQLFEPSIRGFREPERSRLFEGAASLAAPVLGFPGPQPTGSLFAAFHGLYWLAADLAARAPLLLALDDAHWADEPSLRWLAYLLNRLEGMPIVVVLSTRPVRSGGPAEAVAGITADPGVDLLQLGPLGADSVTRMLRRALGTQPEPAFTGACLRTTGGNPLALREVIRDLAARGVQPTATAAAALEQQAPQTITRRVLAQLIRLGEPASRFCRALAVLGDGTEQHLVATLADLDEGVLPGLTDDLAAADLLAPERPLRFAHPLLRAAVYDDIAPGARAHLHARAADLLAAQGADAEAVAAHLLQCEPVGAPAAVEHLRVAAQSALRRGVPAVATGYLRRALVAAAEVQVRVAVLAELGRAELLTRDPAAVEHLQRAAALCPDPVARALIRCDLADAVFHAGDEPLSHGLRLTALAELGDREPEVSARLEILITATALQHPRVVPDHLLPGYLLRLRTLARGEGPASRAARVALAFALSFIDPASHEIRSLVTAGLDGGVFLAEETSDSWFAQQAAEALIFIDDLEGAIAWAEDMLAEAATRGSVVGFVTGSVLRAIAELRAGLLAEAEADLRAADLVARQQGPVTLPYLTAFLAETLWERGDLAAAERLIEGTPLTAGHIGGPAEASLLEVRGRVRCACGRIGAGVADLRACGEMADALRVVNPIALQWRSPLAIALASTAPDEACRLARADLEMARRAGLPRAIGVALRSVAALESDVNAVDLLAEAVEVLRPTPAALEFARALLDQGAALRRLGHLTAAREPLRQALEIATRCGAVPLAQRAREEALLAGARPRRARIRGVDALTPAELRVVRLAAEGRTNRQIAQALFVTAKTVADHLGNAYGKLDVASRSDLASALAPTGG